MGVSRDRTSGFYRSSFDPRRTFRTRGSALSFDRAQSRSRGGSRGPTQAEQRLQRSREASQRAAQKRREEQERRARDRERQRQIKIQRGRERRARQERESAAARAAAESRRRFDIQLQEMRAARAAAQKALNEQLAFQRSQAQAFTGGGGAGGGGTFQDAQNQVLAQLQAQQAQDPAAQQAAFIQATLPEAERQVTQLLAGRGLGGAEQAKAIGRLAADVGTQARLRAGEQKRADVASLLAQFGGLGQDIGRRQQLAQQESQFGRELGLRTIQAFTPALFGGGSLF